MDYDRADLSPRGILLFLVGLLVAGFSSNWCCGGCSASWRKSESCFAQAQPNPMMSAQKLAPAPAPRSVLQNNPPVNVMIFPEPRLQTDDAADMNKFLQSEQKILNPQQPFMDQSGAVHIPISQAMKLIEERGLPVRPNAPPPERRRSSTQDRSSGIAREVPQTNRSPPAVSAASVAKASR